MLDRHQDPILGADVIGAGTDDLAVERCSMTCAAQPVMRAMTNSGVNIGVGTPIMR